MGPPPAAGRRLLPPTQQLLLFALLTQPFLPALAATSTSPHAVTTRYFLTHQLCNSDEELSSATECETAAQTLINLSTTALRVGKEWHPADTMNKNGCWYEQESKALIWKPEGDDRDVSANHGKYLLLCKKVVEPGKAGHHVPALYFMLAFVLLAIGASLFVACLDRLLGKTLPQSLLLVLVGMGTAVIGQLSPEHGYFAEMISDVSRCDPHVLFWVLLPMLLYEDGSSADWRILRPVFRNAITLAVPGVLLSFVILGSLIKLTFSDVPGGGSWSYESCLLLGVILSATDPVAVVGALRVLGAPARFTLLIAGEALLNDATAVVFFLLFFDIARGVKEFTITSSVGSFCRLALGGPGLAVVAMVFCYVTLIKIRHIDPRHFLFLICGVVLGLFFVSELHEVHVSGVLAVVAFAFWYAAVGKDLIAANGGEHLEHAHHQVVSFLASVANDFIFYIAGIVMARYMFFSDMRLQDWLELCLTYVFCHVARGTAILVLLPILNMSGFGVSRKEALLCVVGGLRGAVGLAMALLVELDQSSHPLPLEIRLRIGFHVSGIALLTLLINATFFGKLYDFLSLYPKLKEPNQLLMQKSALLAEGVAFEHIAEMRFHWLFSNLDPEAVLALTPRVSVMLEEEAKEKMQNALTRQQNALTRQGSALHEVLGGGGGVFGRSGAKLSDSMLMGTSTTFFGQTVGKLDGDSRRKKRMSIVEKVLHHAHHEFHSKEHYENVFEAVVENFGSRAPSAAGSPAAGSPAAGSPASKGTTTPTAAKNKKEMKSFDYKKRPGLSCFLVPGLDETFLARQGHASEWLTAEFSSKSLKTLLQAFLHTVDAGMERLKKQRYRMGTWPGATIGEALEFCHEATQGIVRADPCLGKTAFVVREFFPQMPPEIWRAPAGIQAEWALEVGFCRLHATLFGGATKKVLEHSAALLLGKRLTASSKAREALRKREFAARTMLFFCLVLENARTLLQPIICGGVGEGSKAASRQNSKEHQAAPAAARTINISESTVAAPNKMSADVEDLLDNGSVVNLMNFAVAKLDASLKRVLYAARTLLVRHFLEPYPRLGRVWLHSLAAQGVAEDMWRQLELCQEAGLLTPEELRMLEENVFHPVGEKLEQYSQLEGLGALADRAFLPKARTLVRLQSGQQVSPEEEAAAAAEEDRIEVSVSVMGEGAGGNDDADSDPIGDVLFDFSQDQERKKAMADVREQVSSRPENRLKSLAWKTSVAKASLLLRIGGLSTSSAAAKEVEQNEGGAAAAEQPAEAFRGLVEALPEAADAVDAGLVGDGASTATPVLSGDETAATPAAESSDATTPAKKDDDIGSLLRPDRCKDAPPLKDEPVDDVKGVFMVLADWGETPGTQCAEGPACQIAVAKAALDWLKAKGMEHLLRFVLAGGDNVYGGVYNGGGHTLKEVWLDRYDKTLTCVPWYACLGNHDFDHPGPTGPTCMPKPTADNCGQVNGEVEFVKNERKCTEARDHDSHGQVPECWAMPYHSFVVRAWEESLGVTIVSTEGNSLWKGGWPFMKWGPEEKGKLDEMSEESKTLLRKFVLEEDSAKVLLIQNHYPWDYAGESWHLYKDILEEAAKKGKMVYFFGGHTHTTHDPKTRDQFKDENPVSHLIAGGAGGYCGCDEVQGGVAGVVFGMIKTDGTVQFERAPAPGTHLPQCHQ
eukprot:g3557.t1